MKPSTLRHPTPKVVGWTRDPLFTLTPGYQWLPWHLPSVMKGRMTERLKTYSGYIHPTEGSEVVKRGFSWPGFFFGFIWAFVKKLWVLGAVILPFDVVFILSEELGGEVVTAVAGLLEFVISLIVGVNGNAWRQRNLERSGYKLVAVGRAKDHKKALAAFEDEQFARLTD